MVRLCAMGVCLISRSLVVVYEYFVWVRACLQKLFTFLVKMRGCVAGVLLFTTFNAARRWLGRFPMHCWRKAALGAYALLAFLVVAFL
jgi:hypothetical protein